MIRFDNVPPEVVQAMCTPMHLVLPPVISSPTGRPTGALYIGSMSALHDIDLLRDHSVTHLVQVLDVPWLPSNSNGMNCYRIDVLDSSSTDLRPYLEPACNWIQSALLSGRTVLVHCQQGISRSAAIVLAYLIRFRGMNYDEAVCFLKTRRACVKPNPGFVRILREWDAFWKAAAASASRPGSLQRRFTT